MIRHDLARHANTRQGKWLFCVGVSLVAAWFTYSPGGLLLLRYEPDAIAGGQWWRLFTGHLVHVGTVHLLYNLLGLWLIAELLWQRLALRHAAGVSTAAAVWIAVMLAWQRPEIGWYAGLSGVLHALWAVCALEAAMPVLRRGRTYQAVIEANVSARLIGVAGATLLALKLTFEFLYGPSERTARYIGVAVIADAHWYGAVAGVAYWLALNVVRRACRPSLKLD